MLMLSEFSSVGSNSESEIMKFEGIKGLRLPTILLGLVSSQIEGLGLELGLKF